MSTKQKSIWSIDEKSSDDEHRSENTKRERPSSMGLCIECCLLSSFLTAIILASIVALWLTSSSNKTTTTTVLQSISNITETTSAINTTTTAAAAAVTFDCPPVSVGSASILYSTTADISTTYQCFAFTWTAPSSKTVTLGFQFRHNSNSWYLDDVSVYQGSSQIIANGGFETGSLFPWQQTTPNGNCVGGNIGQVKPSIQRTGNYAVSDGCKTYPDQISQDFSATAGQSYTIVFWLKLGATGSSKSANVTLM